MGFLRQFVFLSLIGICFLTACKNNKISNDIYDSITQVEAFTSEIANRDLSFHIYLPEQYDKSKNYPVLYLLHGHGGHDDDWFSLEEGLVKTILDSLFLDNKIPEVIAVSLNADNTWYIDAQVPMETIYMKEFMPFIESVYLDQTNKPLRVLAGNSAGGYGALRFGLIYPEIFDKVILLSPAAYYPSPPEISSSRKIDPFKMNGKFNDSIWKSYSYVNLLQLENNELSDSNFYLSTGDDDVYGILEVVSQIDKRFKSFEIPLETTVINGGHSWDVWRNRFAFDLVRIFNALENND
ncbi:MAG: esterase family protein [Bacteroidia bacterium]|nr:esterase family protein [Bacteroidia bacterium]